MTTPEVDTSRIIAGDVVLLDDGDTAIIIHADTYFCYAYVWSYLNDQMQMLKFSADNGVAYPDDQDVNIQKVISRPVILE